MKTKEPWYIIINPAAANGQAGRQWPSMQAKLHSLKIDHIAQTSEKKGDVIHKVKEAIENGYRKIIAVGGDGTNNEAINGIFLQQSIPTTEVSYTLLPIGTGNDWVKTHEIPRRPEAWLEMLMKENTTIQDIGKVHYQKGGVASTRYFANVAGMGYDAFLCEMLEQQGDGGNKLRYFLLLFKGLAKYLLTRATVRFDQQQTTDTFYTIHVGICRYSGGGMQFVPHARTDDASFALTLIRNVSKLKIVLNTFRLYNGTLSKMPEVDCYTAKDISVQGLEGRPTLLEVDGEFLGETPVSFSIIPRALKIVVP